MFTRQNVRLDKTEPALVVQCGHTAKKHFYLAERGTVLGSARGCDIELAADGVSAVHCVITRGSAGCFIRDCSSRLGTKVNGEKVSEVKLSDGDLLQVGSFVFEVSLPPVPNVDDTIVDRSHIYEQKIEDLEKSRERLMLLAWHLRRRLLQRQNPERKLVDQRPPALAELNLDELEALALQSQAS